MFCQVAWSGSASSKQPDQSLVKVTVAAEGRHLIGIEAKNAPLKRLIEEFASKTNTDVHFSVLPDELVTVTCAGETVRPVLECVLGAHANLVFNSAGTASNSAQRAGKQEIWILGSSFARDRDAQGRCVQAANQVASPVSGSRKPKKKGSALDKQEINRFVDMASSEDPLLRAEALSQLTAEGQTDDESFRRILAAALTDQDPRVRAQAVYGLSRQGGAESISMLQEAMQDKDPDVRRMAVDSVGNDEMGIELLKSALNDGDDSIRELAAMKLAGGGAESKGRD